MKWFKKFNIESFIRESCLVAGFFMLGYGLWLIFPPVSYIVSGLLLMWIGIPSRKKGGG